jgi:hypothetical protein
MTSSAFAAKFNFFLVCRRSLVSLCGLEVSVFHFSSYHTLSYHISVRLWNLWSLWVSVQNRNAPVAELSVFSSLQHLLNSDVSKEQTNKQHLLKQLC